MFDRGITFWHDPTKFLDYTQNNTIVTQYKGLKCEEEWLVTEQASLKIIYM